MLESVLIANRGEIAVRIARTCASLGVRTVGVFSDADADAPHVAAVDEAVRLPGDRPADTYLDAEALLDAARRTGAVAVHPGYGFLSENAAFARAVLDAGLVWVGPTPEVIADLGDKLAAKRRMDAAGVPVLPSVEVTADTDLAAAGEQVGFPVLVKAAAGGGGKGMRVVTEPAELADAVAGAQREAEGAFGDGRVFLERFVTRPRHLEVQVLGDTHGSVVHLFERECSIQRRHQKVVEEAPSPSLPPALRDRLTAAAVDAARAVGYVNAGTVEFVASSDEDGTVTDFHFLEVNTRLQVEHPVTEGVVRVRTGAGLEPVDLVRLQLLVAAGAPLPFVQDDLVVDGHAIEARLYAEDPSNGYLPATGTLHAFVPGEVAGVRWDTGVATGTVVSPFYDPMLAKVIGVGATRDEAAARTARSLATTLLDGVRTNRDLLVAVLRDEAFASADTTTAYLEERFPAPSFPPAPADVELATEVVALHALTRAPASTVPPSVPMGFSNVPLPPERTVVLVAGARRGVDVAVRRDGTVELVHVEDPDGWPEDVPDDAERRSAVLRRLTRHPSGADEVEVEVRGRRVVVLVSATGTERHVLLPSGQVSLVVEPRFPEHAGGDVAGATLAPMPGSVVEVAVAVGDTVARGDLLLVLEAMKMEHRITAPADGVVAEVRVEAGSQVDADAVLVVVEDPATLAEEAGASPGDDG
ncbi:MAG: acetyl/propionyl/methylcrotonyl-CoA carboxylase subunit alpha [Actinomycetes bacterium]